MASEIIKGLENVRYHLPAGEHKAVIDDAIECINRQQAEIERLTKYNTDVAYKHYNDGIKEFADKLKAMLAKYDMYGTLYIVEDIDNLVKEMVGADNG